jgi:hypothetical protein
MPQRDTRKRGEMPPKSGFIGALLSTFLRMAAIAFELLFAQATSQDSYGGGAGYDPFGSNGGESDRAQKIEKDLKDAFQFFECSLSKVRASSSSEREELRSLLKKKWRKLSLLHHPDRNGSSEESTFLSQQLNHHYELVCLEIDRLLTQSARESFDKKLDDKRLWSQLKRINVFGTLYSLLAFALIGRLVFGCGNVVSFAICLSHASAVNEFNITSPDSRHTNFLFILHVFWKFVLAALSLLRKLR